MENKDKTMIHNQMLTLKRKHHNQGMQAFEFFLYVDDRSQLKCLGTKSLMSLLCKECTFTDNSTKFTLRRTFSTFLLYIYSLFLSPLIGVKQALKPSGAGRNVSVDFTHSTKKEGRENMLTTLLSSVLILRP